MVEAGEWGSPCLAGAVSDVMCRDFRSLPSQHFAVAVASTSSPLRLQFFQNRTASCYDTSGVSRRCRRGASRSWRTAPTRSSHLRLHHGQGRQETTRRISKQRLATASGKCGLREACFISERHYRCCSTRGSAREISSQRRSTRGTLFSSFPSRWACAFRACTLTASLSLSLGTVCKVSFRSGASICISEHGKG